VIPAARPGRLLEPIADAADVVAATMSSAARRQRTSLEETAHRPIPLPKEGPWIMGQTWIDLLFAHWPVAAGALRAVVPPELELDLFDGSGWISITPFEVIGTRARGTPPPPGVSRFPELNVRTYVTAGDRGGIWFFSLDALRASAVAAARTLYRLPYFRAEMAIERRDGWIEYESRRVDRRGAPVRFDARYRPTGAPAPPAPGTLDHWLVERYRLYTLGGGRRVMTADIHHRPWPVQPAEAEIRVNTMTEPLGIPLEGAPLLHFARRQDVIFWPLTEVGA
jgi:uncharacterized protein YqjF (DUF2071 family)